MTYVIGGALGLLFGAIVGFLKNQLIWKPYLRTQVDETTEAARVYSRVLISNFSNVAALVVGFLLMKVIPFDGVAWLVGIAVALSIMSRFFSIRRKG